MRDRVQVIFQIAERLNNGITADADADGGDLVPVDPPQKTGHYDKTGRWVNEVILPVAFRDLDGDLHEVKITFAYGRRL